MAATKVKADKLLTICKAKIGQMITEKPGKSTFEYFCTLSLRKNLFHYHPSLTIS
ncbi:MAG: hypothetical protein ACI8RD_014869 [Bacillariaceae sp.]|jgi:hypothetical protein